MWLKEQHTSERITARCAQSAIAAALLFGALALSGLAGCSDETCTGAGCDEDNPNLVNNADDDITPRCGEDNDCPIGFSCFDDGTCRRSGLCETNDDCQEGFQCVEGGCFPIDVPDPTNNQNNPPNNQNNPPNNQNNPPNNQNNDTCTGCVRDTDQGVLCLPGNFDNACGAGGVMCVDCGEGFGCDDSGTCVEAPGCGPDNCNGCCEGDQCRTGTSSSACGSDGFQCQRCENNATCDGGQCVIPCGPESCGGCCDDDGFCVEIADTSAFCGSGGSLCQRCNGEQRCDNGTCVDLGCSETCGGCCSGDTCLAGTSSTDCGFNGEACIDCGPGRLCENSACRLDPRSRWDVVILGADLSETNPNGDAWDAFGGLPDPYVQATTTNFIDDFEGRTETLDSTTSPFWLETILENIPADALQNELVLFIYDDDTFPFEDNVMAACSTSVPDDLFTGETLSLTCTAGENTTEATIRFRIERH